jgi:hypothetical protein
MSMGARRLLALVVAILMVVGALWANGDLTGDGGGDSGNGQHTRTLMCATELHAVCAALHRATGVTIAEEPAQITADFLSKVADDARRDVPFDGWLTFSREPEIVQDARQRAGLAKVLDASSAPIGRSPVVLAVWNDRAQVLAARCGGPLTWKCLGDVAGTSWSSIGGQGAWGFVKPGHADPATTAEGLAVIGQAAAHFLGNTDPSRDDFQDDAFLEWFGRLERAVPANGGVADASPFQQMLAAGPAALDVVATTEAQAGPSIAAASRDRRDRVRLLYPSPVTTADVVFAPVVGRGSDLADSVTGDDGRAALARAGFRVDGEGRAKGVPATPSLPPRENLPDAGALQALVATWREVTA